MNIKLPRVPEYAAAFSPRWPGDQGGFCEIQMIQFATAAVLAERERIACMLDEEHEKRKACDNHAAVYARMIREMK